MKKKYKSPNVEVVKLQYIPLLISTSEGNANPGLPSLSRGIEDDSESD